MADNSPQYRMSIVDIRIPFWRLVGFFVKSTLAAIPAAIILGVIFAAIGVAIAVIWRALGGGGSLEQLLRQILT